MTYSILPTNKWLRIALSAVAALLIVWTVAWLALPPILKSQLPRIASEQLGRKVTLGAVEFEPWSLELTLHDLAVATADGSAAQLKVPRAYLNADIMSLFRLAPVADALTVDEPYLLVTRLKDGSWDIDDIVAKLNEKPKPEQPSSGTPEFALRDVLLASGAVDFVDRVTQQTHEIRDLTLGLPFLSSLGSDRQVVVQPRLSFTLNGVAFKSAADATPFSDTGQTDATLEFSGLDVAPYLAYAPAGLPVELKSAVLGASLQVGVVLKPNPGLKLAGSANAANVNVDGADDRPLLALDQLRVEMASVRPLEQEVRLSSLVLESPRIALRRDEDGTLNLLAEAEKPQPATEGTAENEAQTGEKFQKSSKKDTGSASWKFALDKLAVHDGQLAWLDAAVEPTATAHLRDLRLEASALAFPSAQPASFEGAALIGANVPRGENTALTAPIEPASPADVPLKFSGQASDRSATVQLALDALPFSLARPYLAQFLEPTLSGSVTFDGALEWQAAAVGAQMQATVRARRLAFADIALENDEEKLASLDRLELTGASLRLADRAVEIGRLRIVEPDAKVVRREDGRWNAQDWLRTAGAENTAAQPKADSAKKPQTEAASPGESAGASAPATPSASVASPTAAPSPWSLKLDEFSLEGGDLRFVDNAAPEPLALDLSQIRLDLENAVLGSDDSGSVRFSRPAQFNGSLSIASAESGGDSADAAAVQTAEATQLSFGGSASERVATVNVDLSPLPLSIARPYYAQLLGPDLTGTLALDGTLEWKAAETADGAAETTLRARRFALDDVALADDGQRLASLAQIEVSDASIGLPRLNVDIGKVRIVDPNAKVSRGEDGRWMFEDWLRGAKDAAAKEATKPKQQANDAAAPKPDAPAKGEPRTRWSLRLANLSLEGGDVSFVDRAAPQPLALDLSQIRLGLENATLDAGDPGPIRFAQPARFSGSARVGRGETGAKEQDGAEAAQQPPNLEFSGSATERSATVDVDLSALPLALARPYLAQVLEPRLTGTLTLDGALEWKAAEAADGAAQTVVRAKRLALDDLALVDGKQKVAGIGQIEVSDASIGLPRLNVDIGKVRIVDPNAKVSRGEDGRWMFEDWLRGSDAGAAGKADGNNKQDASGRTAARASWSLNLAALSLERGDVSFVDRAAEPPLALDLSKLQLDLKNAMLGTGDSGSIRFGKPARFEGSVVVSPAAPGDGGSRNAAASPDASAKVEFGGSATERAATVDVDLAAVPLSIARPYLAKLLKPTLSGTLALDGALEWKAATGSGKSASVAARAGRLVLDDLALADGGESLARVSRIEVEGAQADLGAQSVKIASVRIVDPKTTLLRDAQGSWMYQQWLGGAAANEKPAADGAPTRGDAASSWSLELAKLALSGGDVAFVDRAAPKPVALDLSKIELQMQDVSLDGSKAVPVRLSAQLDAKPGAGGETPGRLDWRGRLAWSPRLDLSGTLDANRIPVHEFEPYFGQSLNIDLTRADAGFKGEIAFAQAQGGPKVDMRGDATVTDLQANAIGAAAGGAGAGGRSEELLNFKVLDVRGLDLSMAPGQPTRVGVQQTAFKDFFARMILYPSGKLNLQSLVRQQQGGATKDLAAQQEQQEAGASGDAAQTASAAATVIDFGPTTFENGRLHFTDLLIKPNYSARLQRLNGRLGEFTSRLPVAGKPDLARLELHGQTAQGASLEITGELNPVAKPLVLDVEGKVRDLELPPFSPYSIKYAGYGIKRGKLAMDVSYKVKPSGELTASNEFVLRQLQFGDKAASATKSLPVKLAVSLLADRDGVIDLNIPVSGSLDNPQFSIEDVLSRATGNLLTKAVTAPFSLLARAVQGGPSAEALNSAPFPPGSAELTEAAKTRLDAVVKALDSRPELELTITGTASLNAERDAYLRRQSTRVLQASRNDGASVAGGEPASDAGSAAAAAASPGAAQVGADEMRDLALQRAIAVRDYFAQNGLPKSRLFLGDPKLIDAQRLSDQVKDGVTVDTVAIDDDGDKGADTDASGGYVPHVKLDLTRN